MRDIREEDLNLEENWIFIRDPKEKNFKFVHILPEHSELIREVRAPRGIPGLYFFRHLQARSGVRAGVRFGQKQFRTWWNKACKNLGIEGVELYGGTKHSTVTALGKLLTPEQIKRGATGHVSDAFERYMLPDINEAQIATQAVVQMQPGKNEAGQKAKTGSDPHVIHTP